MEKVIAMYKGGSGIILPNPKDEDIICYTLNNADRIEALKKNTDHSKDYHFVSVDNMNKMTIYAYAYKFHKYISGKKIGVEKYDVLDHKKEYAEHLLDYINFFKKDLKKKHWYHVYLGYCTLKNKGEFTETQINKAQKIHDEGISEKDLNNIIDYLTKIVNN